jgi:hypothetical protein
MILNDVIAADGRVFLKSEWGPIGSHWPALSFSRRSVGDRLRRDFNPNRDVLLYVGTGNGKTTGDPKHQKRLLSAIQAEPNTERETQLLIPHESWLEAQRDYRGRWERSLIVLRAWEIVGFPPASNVIPASYSLLGKIENRGNVVEMFESERQAVLELEISPVELHLREAAASFDPNRRIMSAGPELSGEIGRMVASILDRERKGGTETTRINPVRLVESDLHITLHKKWHEQGGLCALCGGTLVMSAANKLLRASADRINSQLPSCDIRNVHITHLGCNLAKNDVSLQEFDEWLQVVRVSKPNSMAANVGSLN